jgi:hypothetical protein
LQWFKIKVLLYSIFVVIFEMIIYLQKMLVMKKIITLSVCLFILLHAKSQTVSVGTKTALSPFQVANGTVLFSSDTGSTPLSGAGTRLMWIPGKQSLRAGQVTGSTWDNANIGNFSTAFGYNTEALGQYSFAAGNSNSAIGDQSAAFGYSTEATGNTSMAAGISNFASGDYSAVFGEGNTSAPSHSFVIGRYADVAGTSNAWVDADPLFVIGNGYTQNIGGILTTIRSNAFSISKLGNTTITGTTAIADSATIEGSATISGKLEADNSAVINGNLGINESAPKTAVHVKGAIILDSFNVTVSADQPLITVGNHGLIKLHLPNSDLTIEITNGVAVGQLLVLCADNLVLLTGSNVIFTHLSTGDGWGFGTFGDGNNPTVFLMWAGTTWIQIDNIY